MRWLFVIVLAGHGLIHLIGVAKAFGLAELSQLTRPISRPMGVVWALAGLGFLAAAALAAGASGTWWAPALGAVVLSQIAIVSSWRDAKAGTVVNALVVVRVVLALAA